MTVPGAEDDGETEDYGASTLSDHWKGDENVIKIANKYYR